MLSLLLLALAGGERGRGYGWRVDAADHRSAEFHPRSVGSAAPTPRLTRTDRRGWHRPGESQRRHAGQAAV